MRRLFDLLIEKSKAVTRSSKIQIQNYEFTGNDVGGDIVLGFGFMRQILKELC